MNTLASFRSVLNRRLDDLRRRGLFRRRRMVAAGCEDSALVRVDGKPCLCFCSNDYLGLKNHPRVRQSFVEAANNYGVGTGSAHLIAGHTAEHHALEEELAEFFGRDRALLFSTGYMANLGVATALAGRGDVILEDKLNHASLIDAARLSGAQTRRYAHNDPESLKRRLENTGWRHAYILTDGVFSMDGDIARLPEIAEIAKQSDAVLVVDDAHGVGVTGENGRGSVEHFAQQPGDVPVLMGTLGKALGCFGAFVVGDDELIETLVQKARSYIYTTAPPAAIAAAARVALRLIDEERWRRDHLNTLIDRFRNGALALGANLMGSRTPIQPLVLGDATSAVAVSQALFDRGFLVSAIRPPTVPNGSARLRITLSAAHDKTQVDSLLDALQAVLPKVAA